MTDNKQTRLVLAILPIAFVLLAVVFAFDLLGKGTRARQLPLVDKDFLKTETWRRSYANLVESKADLDAFDCYTCHEKGKKQELKYDANQQLVIPDEHSDIVMGHGTHGRNNNCFNCHNDANLLRLQPRDGRELKFEESTLLCGSCHGPTYRDWEAGSHGRTSGYWDRSQGAFKKQDCVNCHNPHSPKFPGRKPAPPPNYLRERHLPVESSPTEH
ncbi:MAG: cytochrome c3 family protein [Verrucomicrobiota bacterium]